ncbi:protein broad-minded isoform X2 [Harpegnathos saltator]|uniref:protein broad-minded isoform X2 n=1 Tax=Harpegnathos saltator TaxID=610380 RepID=UPI000948964B|nr:protein broad-minded isoform X2 [Harpegnathos saltator]
MEKGVPPDLRKWLRKCLRKEFGKTIQNAIDQEQDSSEIARKLTYSRDMANLLNSMKMAITEQYIVVKPSSPASRSQSLLSFTSDLTTDDWAASPQGEDGERYNYVIDKISRDKPVHVRLSGYEILLKIDLSNVNNSSQWDVLQKTLLDGLTDDSRAIFEASMQVHAKLLSCVHVHSIYGNLLNAFNAQYHSQKVRETLPTLISGINFKFFLHEKLFCIMHLIIRYQEELLKSVRHIDKTTEDIVEQFVIFLSTHSFGNTLQPKTLNMLNIISVLEPRAKWSKRWLHGLSTRRTFVAALARSPTFLQNVVECVSNGLRATPCSLTASIVDEGNELCIPGNTIETVTYLHCLVLVSQLCSYEVGRALLTGGSLKASFEIADFSTELSNSLNKLAAEAPSGVYDTCRHALQSVLNVSEVLYNMEFYHAALCHLVSLPENDIKIWPHTLDVISHMVDTADGPAFLTTDCKEHSSKSNEDAPSKCPVAIFMLYVTNLLKRPFSIMDMECILGSFGLMEKLFDVYDVYEAAQVQIETQFYPAVTNFYKKMSKHGVENENKIQQLDSAIKKVLLKMVSIPLGLQALVNEKLVFEELIRGLIVPLRASWSSTDIVSFISSAGYFDLGCTVLADLAPHVLSTLLSQTCANAEDPAHFYDPWDRENTKKFLHILTLFSLNLNCFAAFMTNDESDNDEEKDYPSNLSELLQTAVNENSSYHHLGLLSLSTVIWNLDVFVYLVNSLNFQEALLNIQKESTIIIEAREEQADEDVDYERSMIDCDDGDGDNYKTESTKEYVIDDSSLLRHDILVKSYYMTPKKKEYTLPLEDYQLFSEFPPPKIYEDTADAYMEYDSELNDMLQEERPGLLDIGWVSQVRAAHKASRSPMKNSVVTNLLNQMHKAIPTAEWVEQFVWQENITYDADYWVPEDAHAINVALNYAEQRQILKNNDDTQQKLKQFIHSAYMFIQYNKPSKFEGFDWLLATVFIICDGDLDKCKTFITQLIQFPSTMLLWPKLGRVMDERNNENTSSQFTFMQVLEAMVNIELPNIKYGLKDICGIDCWMIFNRMISQCFWGILSWSEIVHFIAICILYPPDYMVYYCVSLLQFCDEFLLEDLTSGKMWPENMALDEYRCHNYISYMDNLGQRYRNKVLPAMTKNINSEDEL